ncbi:RCC1 domain-containing protein [Cellulosilyticum lentocellum]|uniref:Regulator of chromosome condensation RCC1 n=1 Tax=Cellulosilyticum lentocellum (strain ATCC 49066 / DSM 5427 / NCIMB 11756 / RHM5) TaxID=642492 RepID=F2JIU6_CELLD|nr:hypothetical protein [Cellulosilyticum lentocellum]ADZ82018.1 hypothetical protein Clole_0267 [Cellulosilyticum lentocellum DSM 5427]
MKNTKCCLKNVSLWLLLFLLGSFTLYAKTPSSVTPSFNQTPYAATLLLKADGSLWSVYTEVGNFELTAIAKDVVQVDGNGQFGIFLKKDGTAWYWSNPNHQKIQPTQILSDVQAVHYNNGIFGILKNNGSLWVWGKFLNYSTPTQLMTDVSSFALVSDAIIFQKKDSSLWSYPNLFIDIIDDGKNLKDITPIQFSNQVISYEVANEYLTFITLNKELWCWNTQSQPNKITENVSQCAFPMVLKTNGVLYDIFDFKEAKISPTSIDTNVTKLNPSLSPSREYACTYIKKDGTLWTYTYTLKSSKPFETYQLSSAVANLTFNNYMGFVTLKDGSLWLFTGQDSLPNASTIPGFTLPSSWSDFGPRLKGICLTPNFITPSIDKIKITTKLPPYELLPLWITEKVTEGYEILEMTTFADESFTIQLREFIPQLDDGAFIYTCKGKGEKITRIQVDFPCTRTEDLVYSTEANASNKAKQEAIKQLTGLEPYLSHITKQSIALTPSEKEKLASTAMARASYSIKKSGYTISTLKVGEGMFWGYATLAIDLSNSNALDTNGKFLAIPNEAISRNYLSKIGFTNDQISRKYVNYPDLFSNTSLIGKRKPSASQMTNLTEVSISQAQDHSNDGSYSITWTINQDDFRKHTKQCLDMIKSDVLKFNNITKDLAKKKDLEEALTALKAWVDEGNAYSYSLGNQFTYPSDYNTLNQYDYFLLATLTNNSDDPITISLSW